MDVMPSGSLDYDLVISGIHPLVDGLTITDILKTRAFPPNVQQAFQLNSARILEFTRKKDAEPIAGWVLRFESDVKAVEFRLLFGDKYPLLIV